MPSISIFDSHVHFNALPYSDMERENALKEFSEIKDRFNIQPRIAIDVGFDFNSSLMAIKHAHKYIDINQIFAAVGIHPDFVSEANDKQLENLKAFIINDQIYQHDDGRILNKTEEGSIGYKQEFIKAVGEIGLDYHKMKASKEVQCEWFSKQIRLALECNMPIIVHSREANQDTMDILKAENAFTTSCGILMHSYTGSAEFAKEYIKLGAYFGIGGAVTYENNKKTVEVVRTLPIERLLVETDAPFQSPVPFRGTLNKTNNLNLIISKIAEIKNMTFEEVANITAHNGNIFFRI